MEIVHCCHSQQGARVPAMTVPVPGVGSECCGTFPQVIECRGPAPPPQDPRGHSRKQSDAEDVASPPQKSVHYCSLTLRGKNFASAPCSPKSAMLELRSARGNRVEKQLRRAFRRIIEAAVRARRDGQAQSERERRIEPARNPRSIVF